jgi:hypothetical protein
MAALSLSPIGLLLAAIMSVTNVFTDVARKHALEKRDLVPPTFFAYRRFDYLTTDERSGDVMHEVADADAKPPSSTPCGWQRHS